MSKIKVGEHIKIIPGFPFNSALFNNDGDGLPLIRIRDLLASKIETYYKGEFPKEYLIEQGDILIGMDGDFHIVKWRNKTKALLNQRIMKVAQKEGAKINIEYFYYFLFPFLSEVWEKTTATTVKHLSTYDVSEAEVEFPAFEVQQHIAKILSTADAVIEKTQAAIAKYKAIKQGMLQDLFTRGIDLQTGKLRPRYEDAPELYKESKLGWIPREWDDKELGDVGEVRMCRRVFNYETNDQGDIPFYKIGTFGKQPDAYISKELYDSYRQQFSFPNKGDILISAAGTIGRTIIYDGTPSYFQDSNIVWIENNGELISNEYLYQVFQIVEYKTEGGTIQRLYNSILKSALFPCPPKPEQQLITERLKSIDNKLQTEQTYLQKMQSLKKGLMENLLSGRKRVKVAEELITQNDN